MPLSHPFLCCTETASFVSLVWVSPCLNSNREFGSRKSSSLRIKRHFYATVFLTFFSFAGCVFYLLSVRMEPIPLLISWQRSKICMLWKLPPPLMKVTQCCVKFYYVIYCIYLYIVIFPWITALEALVNNRISGLPVIDDNWNLVIFLSPSLFFFCSVEQFNA